MGGPTPEPSLEDPPCYEAEELTRYALVLRIGVTLAFALIVGASLLDLFGVVEPQVDHALMVQNWHLPHDQYLAATGAAVGWQCLRELHHADMASLAGIGLLSLLSVAGLVSVLPVAVRKRDWAFSAVVAIEALVLVLAALGVLGR